MALDMSIISEESLVSGVLKTSALAFLCYFVFRFFSRGKRYNYPPGPPGLPLLGSFLSLIFSKKPQHEVVTKWNEKYGDIICIKLLNTRLFVVGDARLSKEVFGGRGALDRMRFPILKSLTGREEIGLSFNNGDDWQEQRRFFLSVFKKPEVGGIRYEEIVRDQVARLLTEMGRTDGKPFDPIHLVTTTVGNIATRLMTGKTYEHDDPRFCQVMKHTMRIFEIIGPAGLLSTVQLLGAIPSPGKRQLEEAFHGLCSFVRENIESHKSASAQEQQEASYISTYLIEMAHRTAKENNDLFDETNLLGSCIEILLGGLETTSSVVVWIVHTLASYPEAQSRVRQEILQVIGKDRLPRFSDHNKMPLTMATITECMRLRPAGAFPIAHTASEDFKVGAYDIPKGSPITMNIWRLAQSPRLWEKPESFRPERFLTEDGTFDRKKEPFLFGIGRRSCPGEPLARVEIFLFTTFILQRFNITLAEGVPVDIGTRVSATISPDPYQIHAVKAM